MRATVARERAHEPEWLAVPLFGGQAVYDVWRSDGRQTWQYRTGLVPTTADRGDPVLRGPMERWLSGLGAMGIDRGRLKTRWSALTESIGMANGSAAESAGIPNTRFRWSWWFPSMPRVIRSPAPWTPPNTGVHRHCTDRLGGKSHTSPPGPTGKPRSRLRGGPAGPTRWRSGPPNTPHNKRSTFGWVYPILSHLNTNCGGVDPAFKFASYGSRQRTDCADDCYHWRFHLDTQHT